MPFHAGRPSAVVSSPRVSTGPHTLALLVAASVGLAGCQAPSQTEAPAEGRLTFVDSLLTELGGRPTADMNRGQRWRMISSIGAGLPPSNYEVASLPDPGSRGAVLVQSYCQRCHWIPAPSMHAADEWPVLVRRMVLRARTLQDRMGGEMTEEMLGDILMAGMASADIPTSEEVDSMVAYLQAHALPTAEPGEIGTGPEAEFFRQTCSQCHELPDPDAHTVEEWGSVVSRMRMNAVLQDAPPMSAEDVDRIVAFLGELLEEAGEPGS